jgi:hypothetical protein
MKTTKEENVLEELINEMFRIAGHDVTYDDIKLREDSWYTDWTMTIEQHEQWMEWGAEYLRKSLRLRKEAAKKQMAWFALNYGLKFSDL